MDRTEETELMAAPEALRVSTGPLIKNKTYEETMLLAEDAREATAEEAEETEAAAPEVTEEAAMEALEALGVPEAAETEAPPLVTPAAPAAEVAEAFKQSVEEPSWMVTGEE